MEKGTENNSGGSIKKIALIGPESTGKSYLAEYLADYYTTSWIPEYAREYIFKLNRSYTFKDIESIAKKQIILEQEKIVSAKKFLFIDTELINNKIWFKESFAKIPDWIDQLIEEEAIDYYLLCYPDLKWESDPLRENPDKRLYLFDQYKHEIEKIAKPYKIIKGIGEERINMAIQSIEEFYKVIG